MDALIPPSLSASELGHFLECEERTRLDLAVRRGELERPGQNEVERELLALRGVAHEEQVLEQYVASGKQVVRITVRPGSAGQAHASEETLAAMQGGAEIIYQATLPGGARPDFLVKVAGRGGRWPHHYEVVDAKLAHEARASAVLQLCAYSEQLARVQEYEAAWFYVAAGGDTVPLALRVADYMAYYRMVRRRFEQFHAAPGSSYPEPIEHCGVCPWWKRCDERRRADDHLSLVAGITRRQRDRLAAQGVARLAELATIPAGTAIDGVDGDVLARLHEQARLQASARIDGKPRYRLLLDGDRTHALEPGRLVGLEALPPPTPGDLFLDLEGDAFVGGQGLEYLFGLLELGTPSFDFVPRAAPGEPRHQAHWAHDVAGEKRAFEAIIRRIKRGRDEFGAMHVYHFGQRESDALKKLSCRHKTHEEDVDRLLREHVLIDLHPIVRHALRASVEGYTLKQLEPLHGFVRQHDLRRAARAMQLFGYWLETRSDRVDRSALEREIEAYNREDCFSTWSLRDWLEALRPELERISGRELLRPEGASVAPEAARKNQVASELAERLVALPGDAAERAQHALLANLLEWHWREAKSSWWEYHRARELPPDERRADRAVLSDLQFEQTVGKVKRSTIYRYTFPEQEHAIRMRPTPLDPDTEKQAGTIVKIEATFIDLKRANQAPHPRALIPGKPIGTAPQEESLLELGRAVAGGASDRHWSAAYQLLARRAPEVGQRPDEALVHPQEDIADALQRLVLRLDGGVLAIQGPPGSGKTHQAALMIRELIRAGRRVGVTANSHSVIEQLLHKAMTERGDVTIRAFRIDDDDESNEQTPPFEVGEKKAALKRLSAGELDLVGGTSWVWSHEDFADSVDVLVVDEAGQISLANVLAVARGSKNLVLVGDPAQLEQPQKGVHPPGADASALEHLLGGDALTIPAHLGVFLPDTRRLHPALCKFVSDVFYEGRLQPVPGLERQAVEGWQPLGGAGLRHVRVEHHGNTNQSEEEAARIAELLRSLAAAGASFVDARGERRPLDLASDVLVVAPYNAQVALLKRVLPGNTLVGTVDKFQGRQAPIVIYSLAASTAEDAPKGLEFLYSMNRLNVAVSRAQALAIVVGSPELARARCRTPRQMKLVNALCACLESCSEHEGTGRASD
jgi:predicted RecB family nuclease